MIIAPEMVNEIVVDLQEITAPVRLARGPLAIFKAVAQAVPLVIHEVEGVSAELKGKGIDVKSADKKQMALDVVFALVKLPIWLPRPLMKMIAGLIIDSAVAAVNKHLGK